MSKEYHIQNRFEYFLNAIHYCIWLYEIKFGESAGRIVDVLFAPVPKYLFTKAYKEKYYERLPKEHKKANHFFHDWENGFYTQSAKHSFTFFYSWYPASFSFLLAGFAFREWGMLNNVVKIIILAIPIGLGYIPVYRAMFINNRYLKYFKQFEQEDEQWHKKWKRRTLVFCIGSVVATILGICSIFLIAIV